MSYEKPQKPWEDRPTLVPVVLNAIAAVIFLVMGVMAVMDGRSWIWLAAALVMIALITYTTLPMYRRWRDKKNPPITR